MKLVELEGLTGKVKFDQLGRRTEFELQIVELKKHGLEKAYGQKKSQLLLIYSFSKVGVWTDQVGIKFSRNFTESYSEIVESLQNKTLVVTTIMVLKMINLIFKVNFTLFSLLHTACSKSHLKNLQVTMLLRDSQLI